MASLVSFKIFQFEIRTKQVKLKWEKRSWPIRIEEWKYRAHKKGPKYGLLQFHPPKIAFWSALTPLDGERPNIVPVSNFSVFHTKPSPSPSFLFLSLLVFPVQNRPPSPVNLILNVIANESHSWIASYQKESKWEFFVVTGELCSQAFLSHKIAFWIFCTLCSGLCYLIIW